MTVWPAPLSHIVSGAIVTAIQSAPFCYWSGRRRMALRDPFPTCGLVVHVRGAIARLRTELRLRGLNGSQPPNLVGGRILPRQRLQ